MSERSISEIIARAQGLHAAIGKDIVQPGDYHECASCGHTQPLTAADAARYLAHGWPRHCGKEMRWKHEGGAE